MNISYIYTYVWAIGIPQIDCFVVLSVSTWKPHRTSAKHSHLHGATFATWPSSGIRMGMADEDISTSWSYDQLWFSIVTRQGSFTMVPFHFEQKLWIENEPHDRHPSCIIQAASEWECHLAYDLMVPCLTLVLVSVQDIICKQPLSLPAFPDVFPPRPCWGFPPLTTSQQDQQLTMVISNSACRLHMKIMSPSVNISLLKNHQPNNLNNQGFFMGWHVWTINWQTCRPGNVGELSCHAAVIS